MFVELHFILRVNNVHYLWKIYKQSNLICSSQGFLYNVLFSTSFVKPSHNYAKFCLNKNTYVSSVISLLFNNNKKVLSVVVVVCRNVLNISEAAVAASAADPDSRHSPHQLRVTEWYQFRRPQQISWVEHYPLHPKTQHRGSLVPSVNMYRRPLPLFSVHIIIA